MNCLVFKQTSYIKYNSNRNWNEPSLFFVLSLGGLKRIFNIFYGNRFKLNRKSGKMNISRYKDWWKVCQENDDIFKKFILYYKYKKEKIQKSSWFAVLPELIQFNWFQNVLTRLSWKVCRNKGPPYSTQMEGFYNIVILIPIFEYCGANNRIKI